MSPRGYLLFIERFIESALPEPCQPGWGMSARLGIAEFDLLGPQTFNGMRSVTDRNLGSYGRQPSRRGLDKLSIRSSS